jgi:hypothetical protein
MSVARRRIHERRLLPPRGSRNYTFAGAYASRSVAVNSYSNNGAEGQDRTVDTRFFRPVLYQLSYLGDPRRSVATAPPTTYGFSVKVAAIGGCSSQRSSTKASTCWIGPHSASYGGRKSGLEIQRFGPYGQFATR